MQQQILKSELHATKKKQKSGAETQSFTRSPNKSFWSNNAWFENRVTIKYHRHRSARPGRRSVLFRLGCIFLFSVRFFLCKDVLGVRWKERLLIFLNRAL